MNMLIKLKKQVFTLLFLWVLSPQSLAGIDTGNVGLLIIENDKQSLITTKEIITKNDIITSEYVSNNKIQCCIRIDITQIGKKQFFDSATDVFLNKPVYSYDIKKATPLKNINFIGMTYIGNEAFDNNTSRTLTIRHLKTSGKNSIDIYLCLSQEGIHLYTLNNSKLSQHIYYNLGYEVTPNCPDYVYNTE
ncbi:hypothetical protein EYY98_23600 [Obesumbacterium proteus]|nr:hypothetical protein EYY98_23600 [Obesumbacterium proteus]